MGDPRKLWSGLNERQRVYLRTIFEIDQEQEAWERGAWNRGERSRPAAEWRWIRYDSLLGDPPLRSRLKMAGLVDPGTGSTFQALEARKLIETRVLGPVSEQHLDVKLTTLGRKVARAGLGVVKPTKLPPGTLTEWQWQAVIELYEADEAGLGQRSGGGYGSASWATCLRLINYGSSSHDAGVGPMSLLREQRMADGSTRAVITTYGRWFYAQYYADYQALYSDVAAPAPRGDAPVPAPLPKIAPAPLVHGLVGPGVQVAVPFIMDMDRLVDVGTVVWVVERKDIGRRVAKAPKQEQVRWGAWRATHPELRVGIVRGVIAWWDPLERNITGLGSSMLVCASDGKREVFAALAASHDFDDAYVPVRVVRFWDGDERVSFRFADLCWQDGSRRGLVRELKDRMQVGVAAAERSAATKVGMERARERGVHVGRPAGSAPAAVVLARYPEIVEALRAGGGIRATARDLGVAVNTVRKVAAAMGEVEER